MRWQHAGGAQQPKALKPESVVVPNENRRKRGTTFRSLPRQRELTAKDEMDARIVRAPPNLPAASVPETQERISSTVRNIVKNQPECKYPRTKKCHPVRMGSIRTRISMDPNAAKKVRRCGDATLLDPWSFTFLATQDVALVRSKATAYGRATLIGSAGPARSSSAPEA